MERLHPRAISQIYPLITVASIKDIKIGPMFKNCLLAQASTFPPPLFFTVTSSAFREVRETFKS